MSTKDRILKVSLELFSKRGFTAVSVREITAQVGVRESALYRHFASKRAVFEQLVADYLARSDAFMDGIHALPTDNPADLSQAALAYTQLSDEEFLLIGTSVFTDFLMQPDTMLFWRMISIERFKDRELAQLWHDQLFEAPIAFQTGLFMKLIETGVVKPVDPALLALEFFTPLLLLYLQALPFEPGSAEFERSLQFAISHMRHFRETYTVKPEGN